MSEHDSHTAGELRDMPTLAVGQTDNLKIDNGDGWRVWLARTTVEDGEPYDDRISVEHYDGQRWETVNDYPG